MTWLNRNKEEEGHNFWQNYTDLMSGFLIVFIIASLVAYHHYQAEKENFRKEKEKYEALINMVGGTTGADLTQEQLEQLEQLVANAQLYQKVKDFDSAQVALNSKYFHYDRVYRRYECIVGAKFVSRQTSINPDDEKNLIAAGKDLVKILEKFPKSENVSFKVVIDGRAALKWDKKREDLTLRDHAYADSLSYCRSRNLYNLWDENEIIKQIEDLGGEFFTSGSGYKGKGRHTRQTDPNDNDPEGLNKRFIIQVIPYIKF